MEDLTMDQKEKPATEPDQEKDLPQAEDRRSRFQWEPGDLVFVGNVNDEPKPDQEPESKPEK